MSHSNSKTCPLAPEGTATLSPRAHTAHLGRPQQGPGRGNSTPEETNTMHPCPGADERRARTLMIAAMRPRGAWDRTADAQVSTLPATAAGR